MNLLTQLRASRGRSTGSTLAFVALAWLALIAPPCVMGLTLDAGASEAAAPQQDCPHCLPEGSVDVARDQCTTPDELTPPRTDKPAEPLLLVAAVVHDMVIPPALMPSRGRHVLPHPPPRPGPRAHLRHGQFNE